MTGARAKGIQQEEDKAYFSVSFREHNMSFKLDSVHIQRATYNFLLYFIQNVAT